MAKVCKTCEKERPDKQFPVDARTSDNLSAVCIGCRALAKADESDVLETVDLDGVEILAAGGPYFGQGSPPEGDEFTEDEIDEIATANQELEGEIRPFLKIGHNKAQKLLKASGLADDELPAAGWWTNFRAKDGKLLADVKKVPKKLAALIEAGAFRTRSVELSRVTSQRGKKKKYKAVVTAVSLLGARAPAVHTLADIVALYADVGEDEATRRVVALLREDDAGDVDVPETRYVALAAGDVVWNPDDGCNGLSEKVRKALNPGPSDYRYWVMDVARDASRAIVGSNGATYIVPIELVDGDVKISASADWTLAEQAWVESASEYARALGDRIAALSAAGLGEDGEGADTSGQMPTGTAETKFSDEQIAALATAFSIEETDASKRRELVVARLSEGLAGETEPPTEGDPPPATPPAAAAAAAPATAETPAIALAEIETLKASNAVLTADLEKRTKAERDADIETALSEGRIEPSKREFWTTAYDEDPERARVLLAEMPVNPEFTKVYGKDNTGVEPGDAETALAEAWGSYMGTREPAGSAA